MRADLLALTPDDLTLLANRGLVRRAQQELLSGELTWELEEDAQGALTLRWSDGVECRLPAGRPPTAGRCSCPATTLCRHLIRSVLAYQQQAQRQPEDAAPEPHGPWDPGAIGDEELARLVARAPLAWARQAFEAGQVLELVRAHKPSAYVYTGSTMVRFLVPGDLRYTHCDCAEPAPCRHVPLAVWAFRRLEPQRASGLVETAARPAAGAPLLEPLEQLLAELLSVGLAGAPQPLVEQLRRLEAQLRAARLIWPAEALAELVQQHSAYAAHDARFAPAQALALLGELCVRADAIRSDTGAVPQLFLCGSQDDSETAVGAARLVGLGCAARPRRGGVELLAYMQDSASGALVAVRHEARDPQQGDPAPLWQIGQQPLFRGATLAGLAAGQAMVKGGRRRPNAEFVPVQSRLALNPQSYAWESLRGPALVEDFAELAAHVAAQPPAALRPRRLTDAVYVCPLAGAQDAGFDAAEQAVRATLRDPSGGSAALVHPYTTRGAAGAEALLRTLRRHADELRFVAGHLRLSPQGLLIAPTALVLQDAQGRRALLPWLERGDPAAAPAAVPPPGARPRDPLADYWARLEEALAELLLVGLGRADARAARHWRDLAADGAGLGFARALGPVERLAAALEHKLDTLRWQPAPACAAALELACLIQIAAGAQLQMVSAPAPAG